jgi:hypothetical protein
MERRKGTARRFRATRKRSAAFRRKVETASREENAAKQ